MLTKQARADYFNQEYLLNEFEYKEFNFQKVDQYWRIRALLYTFSLDPIGDKETLIKRIENELFFNYLYKRLPDEDLKEVTDTELESLMKVNKNKNTNGPSIESMEEQIKESWELFYSNTDVKDGLVQEADYPWDIVKEISRQNRRFTYIDIHRGLTNLMRPTMVFFNHC